MTVHSPGRINLIGEHVDYSGGLVMPASIDKAIRFEVTEHPGRELALTALDLSENHTLSLPVTGRTGTRWVDYLAGIVDQFQQLGHEVPGLKIEFGGDIPQGAGMSSSAALEGGMAFVLNELTGAGLTRPELAQLCNRSSNEFLEIPSGIMDQFASLNGSAAGPIQLDCGTLEFQSVNAELAGYTWLLVNSMITHELSAGEYHTRVAECREALSVLQEEYPALRQLSEATQVQLQVVMRRMPENVSRRARYVVAENERVLEMALALSRGDVRRAGQLLNETHAGLRDEYEVSCTEVDFLQRHALEHFPDAVAGARIMGGGFGGCTINLLRDDRIEEVKQYLRHVYRKKYGITPEFYPVNIGPGTHLV